MKSMKKWLCLSLALIMAVGLVMIPSGAVDVAEAEKNAVANALIEKIKANYAEYYTIPRISAEVVGVEQNGGNTVYTIAVSLARVLRAESAADLPYVQGMLTEAAQLDAACKSVALSDLAVLVSELEAEYIGKEQEENGLYQVSVPAATARTRAERVESAAYSVVYMDDMLFPVESLRPASQNELREQGKAQARTYTVSAVAERQSREVAEASVMSVTVGNDTAKKYNRIKARDYIRQYCCNSGAFHECPYANTAEYRFVYANGKLADCANYVSQAINYGGISRDSVWAPYTQAWVNVGAPYRPNQAPFPGLTTYMLEKDYFFQTTDKFKAFAGSIVYWYGDHVGMVDQNDTVTMTYCAHNACQKQAPFGSDWVYGFYGEYTLPNGTQRGKVSFFVPVWDSYANTWTPQN